VDSSGSALAAACLFLTCLPQQHLVASSAIKVKRKWCDFIVIIVLRYILTTYFGIDFVNRTVFGPPVARQSPIRPTGQKVRPPLPYRVMLFGSILLSHSKTVNAKGVSFLNLCTQ